MGLVIRAVKDSAERTLKPRPPNAPSWQKFEYEGFTVKLLIENTGKEPIIIFNPNIAIGTGLSEVRICFAGYQHRFGSGIEDFEECSPVVIEKTQDQRDALRMMSNQFDVQKPPENLTIILKPGESIPFNEDVKIDSNKLTSKETVYDHVEYTDESGRKKQYTRSAKYFNSTPNIELTYEFSFVPYSEDPNILEKMALRWRKFGRLPVSQNGTYKIVTDKFPL